MVALFHSAGQLDPRNASAPRRLSLYRCVAEERTARAAREDSSESGLGDWIRIPHHEVDDACFVIAATHEPGSGYMVRYSNYYLLCFGAVWPSATDSKTQVDFGLKDGLRYQQWLHCKLFVRVLHYI